MQEPVKPKRRIEPEMMVAVSAVFIGVCALIVSLYETRLMQQEQRASVLPMLELSRSFWVNDDETSEDQWRLTFDAENVGIGPARVIDFVVTVDGAPHPTWDEAIKALLNRDESVAYGQSTINGRTIPVDRKVTMFNLVDRNLAPLIIDEFERMDFEACYCSVFDECWTTSYSTFGTAEPVEACHRSDDSFQQ